MVESQCSAQRERNRHRPGRCQKAELAYFPQDLCKGQAVLVNQVVSAGLARYRVKVM
jgi:hypothetical protein